MPFYVFEVAARLLSNTVCLLLQYFTDKM